ncbi:hypothetical protein ABFX02_01G027700 [Erythranthe guttata]
MHAVINIRRRVLPLVAAVRLLSVSTQPNFTIPIPSLLKRTPPEQPPPPPQNPSSAAAAAAASDFTRISEVLSNPAIQPGPDLERALTAAEVDPSSNLLLEVFNRFVSAPKPLFTLFNWARNRPDYQFSIAVFNAAVNALGKAREFDSAWCLILDQVNADPTRRPDSDTFLIMIRRYTRAGFPLAAIRTFEYATSLNFFHSDPDTENNLFDKLLDSLCKEGHVSTASQYCENRKTKDPSWAPPIRVYNILLNGYLRSRKLKHAMRLWESMKKEKVKANVVTYGTLIEGLCRLRLADMAIELLNQMKTEGVKPNAIVYNPIIDALGEAGRFKEAIGMLERFSILETGPTLSTYNSLVKGFCKAGDIVEASKIVRTMIDDKCLPTTTTYSYFFKHFSKTGNIDAGLTLYKKLIRVGYDPDGLTYHLLLKMLSKEGNVEFTLKIVNDMREKGFDLDLASSTMLINLLWRQHRYDEAAFEFEDMLRKGIVPQHITYTRLSEEMEKNGRGELARKLHDLMKPVTRSTKMPDTCKESRSDVMERAELMSDVLKTCNDPRELVKQRYQPENDVISAQKLTENIRRKAELREAIRG